MNQVILYGFIGAFALVFGAVCGAQFKIKEKIIGLFVAFGAGALIAALSFGLLEESNKLAGIYHTTWAFVLGGLIFVIGDLIIIKIGGRGHKRVYKAEETTGWAIVLGAVLDGIPESLALGVALLVGKGLGLLMMIAIFLSNFPEGISSAYDLLKAGQSKSKIFWTWVLVALSGFVCVILGYTIFGHIAQSVLGITEAIAAGALLAMLASTMMPEAYQESGLSVSMVTLVGFLVIFVLSKIHA
ncbi:MAG: ZIP family metal transporter [Candidatus Berkelbacteria bacterium]|nr:ZIP family metal transporter [Candidatus Berkelbacteria bacterium]